MPPTRRASERSRLPPKCWRGLYNLYRFAYDDRIDEPDQLRLWREEG